MIWKEPTRCCLIWRPGPCWRAKALGAARRGMRPFVARGNSVVSPPRSNRKAQRDFDRDAYKARHLIENFFCKLKQYRAIATRYDKTARNFLAAIHLAAAIIWLN